MHGRSQICKRSRNGSQVPYLIDMRESYFLVFNQRLLVPLGYVIAVTLLMRPDVGVKAGANSAEPEVSYESVDAPQNQLNNESPFGCV